VSFSDLFSRRRKDETESADAGADAPVHPTKALAKFLSSFHQKEQPLLLDVGPAIGTNVTFFGEELGCKILIGEIFKDIDRHVAEGTFGELPKFFETRFAQWESDSVDGILCWDIFDYLDWKNAQALAKQLVRILRPDGAVLAQFSTAESKGAGPATYTKYVIVDRQTLQYRSYPAARGKQKPLLNRDIQRMFEPLRVAEQFLLKNNLREVLLRKAGSPAAPATPVSSTDEGGPKPPGGEGE
jgi:hypothetical protein